MSGIPEIVQQLQSIAQQRDSAWEELRKIRELIRADPNESTYDEVVRLLCPGAGRGRLKDGVPEHPRDSTDEDVERVWREWWVPCLTGDAPFEPSYLRVMPIEVKRELYDYSILLEHVPKVYSEVTGGRVSKPNTVAAAVIGEYEEDVKRLCDQAVEDYKDSFDLTSDQQDAAELAEWRRIKALYRTEWAHKNSGWMGPRVRENQYHGHAHGRDSVWDSDNGPLAGCDCAACAMHAAALAEEADRDYKVVDHAGPQPAPLPGRADVLDALLEDYKVRAEAGLKKYGTRLQTFNGRNGLVDALQEAMDLSLYLKQRLMEEEARQAGGAS